MARATPQEQLAILQRRKLVAQLYLRGQTQWEIARNPDIAVDQKTVSRDLVAIRAEWRESTLLDFDARKDQELAKIDRLEVMAHEAWERSCQDAESMHVKTEKTEGGDDKSTKTISEKTTKGQAGDPRFLERIAWCIDKRCELLQIDPPKKIAPTTPDGQDPYTDPAGGPGDVGPLVAALVRAAAQLGTGGDAAAAEPGGPPPP